MFLHDSVTSKGFCRVEFTHLVCLRGMGREMHRKGSNVLLCLRQCGHVRDDLEKKNKKRESKMVKQQQLRVVDTQTYYIINTHK